MSETTLKELVLAIVADGVVDEVEVETLGNAIYADGVIDRKEADAMFEINDAVTGNDNHESYRRLFVKSLSDYVLDDGDTPGVVDEVEGKYLVEKIGADGEVDEQERDLLLNIKSKATAIESQELKDLIASIE